ncbi:MAG: prepilin-type N-terminal cleavage/methylation domain-containing protein [Dehalococcoidia bacterium]
MLKTTEKGFTLIEVLVALAILGAIMGVMSAAVISIMKVNTQNTEWNVNLRQVQNAGHWISRDALMAQVVSDNKTGVFLALTWSDWDGNSYNVDYVLNVNDSTLTRQLNVRHLDGSTDDSTLLIAKYIDPAFTTCSWDGDENNLTVTIKASLHGNKDRYVKRTYEISPRPALRGG